MFVTWAMFNMKYSSWLVTPFGVIVSPRSMLIWFWSLATCHQWNILWAKLHFLIAKKRINLQRCRARTTGRNWVTSVQKWASRCCRDLPAERESCVESLVYRTHYHSIMKLTMTIPNEPVGPPQPDGPDWFWMHGVRDQLEDSCDDARNEITQGWRSVICKFIKLISFLFNWQTIQLPPNWALLSIIAVTSPKIHRAWPLVQFKLSQASICTSKMESPICMACPTIKRRLGGWKNLIPSRFSTFYNCSLLRSAIWIGLMPLERTPNMDCDNQS